MDSFRITPAGDFSLAASIDFLTGFTPAGYAGNGAGAAAGDAGPVLRLAFGVERQPLSVGVSVRQGESGVVQAQIEDVAGGRAAELDHDVVRAQIARILSLDVDATGLAAALRDDPHAVAVAGEFRGLRPVCFTSPYEAAAWAVLSQRVQSTQAARLKARIAREFGTQHEVAGESLVAFPRPEVLLESPGLGGLVQEVKVGRLQAVARATLDGVLDGERLRSMDGDQALASLRTIDGVGPFSADLILVRGAGHPDRFPRSEGRLHQQMSAVYGVPEGDVDALEQIAGNWTPFRSWVSFYYRNQAARAR